MENASSTVITLKKKVIVVGGPASFVKGTFSQKLAGVGLEVTWHSEYDHKNTYTALPQDCEAVVILKDMVSHSFQDRYQKMASKKGVPVIRIPRKWAKAEAVLEAMGIFKKEPQKTVALDYLPPEQTNPVALPTKKAPTSSVREWTTAIIEDRPPRILSEDQLLKELYECMPEAKLLPREVVQSEMRKGRDDLRTLWASGAAPEALVRRNRAATDWLKQCLDDYRTGKSTVEPSRTFIRQEGRKIFGVQLNWDLVREARAQVYGEWARDLDYPKNFYSQVSAAFEKIGHAPLSFAAFTEAVTTGAIKSYKTSKSLQTSWPAVEEWLSLKLQEKAPTSTPEPAIPTPAFVPPSPAPVFAQAPSRVIKLDAARIQKDLFPWDTTESSQNPSVNRVEMEKALEGLQTAFTTLVENLDSSVQSVFSEHVSLAVTQLEQKTDTAVSQLEQKTDTVVSQLELRLDAAVSRLEQKLDSVVLQMNEKLDLILAQVSQKNSEPTPQKTDFLGFVKELKTAGIKGEIKFSVD